VCQLTPEGQILITTAVTAATTGFTGGLGGIVGSALTTEISGFTSNLAVGTINNGGNVGKGIKESTSKQALRSLGKNMLAAGVTTGIMNGTGFGNVNSAAAKLNVNVRNMAIAEQTILRTGVNTAVYGGSLTKNFKREVGLGLLHVGQGYIGDIGQRYGLSEGGAAKMVMHSALGGVYGLATGGNPYIAALAGGMGEALSGLSSSLGHSPGHEFSGTGESGTGLSNWNDTIVAATAMLAGGNASDMQTATTVSSSVAEYNRRLHPREKQLLEIAKSEAPKEEHILYDAAALDLVHGDEGVNVFDPKSRYIKKLVALGKTATAQKEKLLALADKMGWEGGHNTHNFTTNLINTAMMFEGNGLVNPDALFKGSKPFEYTWEDI